MMRLYTMAVALAAVLLVSACSPQETAHNAPVGLAAEALPPATATRAAVDLSGRSTGELQDAADRALREGRLYSPAGDSAIEYWLEARKRDPGSGAVASAIAGLQPYLLIGCEEAIARHDVVEARRLHGLIAAADADAPALPRLAAAIAQAAAEAGRAEEAARLAVLEAERQRAAADALASAPAAAPSAAPAPVTAPPVEPARDTPPQEAEAVAAFAARDVAMAAAAPAVVERAPPPPPPSPSPSPEVAPRLLHQPPPRYPPLALSRRLEGSVQVAFTIRADGRVEGARVVSATPPGVFERAALAAVAGYRFEPAGRSVASSVTLRFSLGS